MLDVGRQQAGLQGQRGERREKLGQTVGGQVALDRSVMDSLQPGKSDRMVGMLLEQCRNERGSVETGIHDSESADFAAALVALPVDESANVPSGCRNFAGANKNAIFL